MDANKLFFKNIINEGLLLKLEDREIEKLKGESKSTISRKLNKEESDNE